MRVSRLPVPPYRELEETIRSYHLDFIGSDHSGEAEHVSLLPASEVYYQLIDDPTVPPQQSAFLAVYLDRALKAGRLANVAVASRVARAYPSLVRQHHAELVLRSAFPWTFRSQAADQNGVDLVVISDRGTIGLALSVNTEAARAHAFMKAQRQPKTPFPLLTVYCDPYEHVVGSFWLHEPQLLLRRVDEFCDDLGWTL